MYKLGTVEKEESIWVRADHYANGRAEYKTIVFEDGLEIGGLIGLGGNKLSPVYVNVSSNHWKIRYNLGVGVKTSSIIKQLGEPDKKDDEGWFYSGMIHSVKFFINAGVVTKVTFQYHDG